MSAPVEGPAIGCSAAPEGLPADALRPRPRRRMRLPLGLPLRLPLRLRKATIAARLRRLAEAVGAADGSVAFLLLLLLL